MSSNLPAEVEPEAAAFALQLFERWNDYAEGAPGRRAQFAAQGATPEERAEARAQRVLKQPPSKVTWDDFLDFFEHDPEGAMAWWRELAAQVRTDWKTGFRAALIQPDQTPEQRAVFLTLRSALMEGAPPTNGLEWGLFEVAAQSLAQYLFWSERLSVESPEAGRSEAIEQSAAMAERFSRGFFRAVHTLSDLRRSPLSTVIGIAAQANVTAVHVNAGNRKQHPSSRLKERARNGRSRRVGAGSGAKKSQS